MGGRTRTSPRLWLGLMLALLGTVALIVATEPEPQAALQKQRSVQVDLIAVKRSSVFPAERTVGRLMPAQRAALSFEVPGRVVRRLTEPGARVPKRQPLLSLADGDARDRLNEAEARYQLEEEAIQLDRQLLALAVSSTILQRSEVQRLETLKASALSSSSQIDAAQQTQLQLKADEVRLRHAVRTASARLELRKNQRDQARRQLQRATLRAPFAGTINRVEVDVGDYVSPNQTVVEIVDLESLDLYVEVRGAAIDHLALGQTATVTVDNRALPARLHALRYNPDPLTNTHALRFRLPAHGARAGEIASVELPRTPIHDALIVPVSALLTTDGKAFVFHYADNLLQRKPVTLGPRVGDVQVITSGLGEGDRIVARDIAGLSDGQTVDVVPEAG